MRHIRAIAVLATATLTSFAAVAQVPVVGPMPSDTPAAIADALGLNRGVNQDLTILPNGPTGWMFAVTIEGQSEVVRIWPHDVRSPNVVMSVRDQHGAQIIPVPPSVTYRGSIIGRPASRAAISYFDGGLRGLLWVNANEPAWGIDPVHDVDPTAPLSTHVLYRSTWVQQHGTCGTVDTRSTAAAVALSTGTDVLELAQLAIECDAPYMSAFANNTTSAQNAVTTVVNGVDAIYDAQTEITYEIVHFEFDINSDPYSTTSGGTLLNQMRTWWNSNLGGIQRDIAHLFSGRNFNGGTLGVAFTGTVCTNSHYGVSDQFSVSNTATRIAVVTHEMGHNWNAVHCSIGSGDCRIMCSGLGGCTGDITQFGQASINSIVAFKNTRTCLSPAAPPVLTSVTPSPAPAFSTSPYVLTGTNLSSVTEVRFLGQVLLAGSFTIVNDTQIQFDFDPPNLGTQWVWVIGNGSSSNLLTFNVVPTSPPDLSLPFAVFNTDWNVEFGGQPNHLWVLFASFTGGATAPVLGIDFLINSFEVLNGTLDAAGLGSWTLPGSQTLHGVTVHANVIMVDPGFTALTDTPVRSTLFL